MARTIYQEIQDLKTGSNLAYIELCYLFTQSGARKYGSAWRALIALEEVLHILDENKFTEKLIKKGLV